MPGSCHEISSRHRQGTNTKYFPPPPRFLYVMSAQFTPPFNIPRFVHITKVPDLKNRRNLHFHWMNPKLRRVGANERPPPHWRARGGIFPFARRIFSCRSCACFRSWFPLPLWWASSVYVKWPAFRFHVGHFIVFDCNVFHASITRCC